MGDYVKEKGIIVAHVSSAISCGVCGRTVTFGDAIFVEIVAIGFCDSDL